MEIFEPYGHALAAMALWAVIVFVLSALSTVGRTAEARCDCGKPKRDYSDPEWRDTFRREPAGECLSGCAYCYGIRACPYGEPEDAFGLFHDWHAQHSGTGDCRA